MSVKNQEMKKQREIIDPFEKSWINVKISDKDDNLLANFKEFNAANEFFNTTCNIK